VGPLAANGRISTASGNGGNGENNPVNVMFGGSIRLKIVAHSIPSNSRDMSRYDSDMGTSPVLSICVIGRTYTPVVVCQRSSVLYFQ